MPLIKREVSPIGLAKMDRATELAQYIYSYVVISIPHTRERSIALTKIEEVVFWINKAISIEEEAR